MREQNQHGPGDPTKPSITEGIIKMYQNLPLQSAVPSQAQAEEIARQYAGREAELWGGLYAQAGQSPTPELIDKLVNYYDNPFFESVPLKKKDGTSSGDAPTAEATSSGTEVIQEGDGGPRYGVSEVSPGRPLVLTSPYDPFRRQVNQTYQDDELALRSRMAAGTVNQDEAFSILDRINRRRDNSLAGINALERIGLPPSMKQDDPEQLDLIDQAVSELQGGAGIREVFTAINNDVLDQVMRTQGLSRPEAIDRLYDMNAAQRARYGIRGRSGIRDRINLEDYPYLPDELIEKVQGNFPYIYDLPNDRSAFNPEGPFQWDVLPGDMSREHGYEYMYATVDKYLDANAPDMATDVRSRVRQTIISRLKSSAGEQLAMQRARNDMEQLGIAPPEEVIRFIDDFEKRGISAVNEILDNQFRMDAVVTQREAERSQRMRDLEVRHKNEYADLYERTQRLVDQEAISVEQQQEYLDGLIERQEGERDTTFNEITASIASQRRELTRMARERVTDPESRFRLAAQELGIPITDERPDINAYLNRYSALLRQHNEEVKAQAAATIQQRWNNLGVAGRAAMASADQTLNLLDGFGGGLRWMGYEELGQELRDFAEAAGPDTAYTDLGEFNWSQLGNADWWAEKALPVIPGVLSLAIPGLGIGGAFGRGAIALGAGKLAVSAVSAITGGLTQRAFESVIEAGTRFNNDIAAGKSLEEAGQNASQIFRDNSKLAAFDILQYGLTFGRVPMRLARSSNMVGRLVGATNTMLGKGAINFVSEGFEEVLQEYFNERIDNPLVGFGEFISTPEAQEVFALGGVMGLGFSVMGGSEGGRIALLHRDMMEMTLKGGDVEQNILERHNKVLGTLSLLRKRGVLTRRQYNQAVAESTEVANSLTRRARGDLPGNMSDVAHLEYTVLSRQYNRLQEQNRDESNEAVRSLRERRMREVRDRMDELINDPANAKQYLINGMPVNRDDMIELAKNENFMNEVADQLGPNGFKIINDPLTKAHVNWINGNVENAVEALNELVEETNGVSSMEELRDHADAFYNRKEKDADMWLSVKAAIDEQVLPEQAEVEVTEEIGAETASLDTQMTDAQDTLEMSEKDLIFEEATRDTEKTDAMFERAMNIEGFYLVQDNNPQLAAKIAKGEPLTTEEKQEAISYASEAITADLTTEQFEELADPEVVQALKEAGQADEATQLDEAVALDEARTEQLLDQAIYFEEFVADPNSERILQDVDPALAERIAGKTIDEISEQDLNRVVEIAQANEVEYSMPKGPPQSVTEYEQQQYEQMLEEWRKDNDYKCK